MAPASAGDSVLGISVPEDILGTTATNMSRVDVGADSHPPSPSELSFPAGAPLLTEHLREVRAERARILVIDDHPEIVRVIERLLAPHHDILTASNGEEGLQKIHELQPALVISDVMMPKMSGFQLVELLRKDPATERLPVLLLTARADGHDRVRGLRRGASDYLVKPFLPEELKARVSNLLRAQHYESYLTRLNEELAAKSSSLEGRVHGLFIDTVRTLVAAIDAKDSYTGGHSERVSSSRSASPSSMKLTRPMLRTIELGALLHDVGKIGIPDKRPQQARRADPRGDSRSSASTPCSAARSSRSRPSSPSCAASPSTTTSAGTAPATPTGLAGDDIPPSVRVVSVADCWDAMVSDRIYRAGMEPRIAAEKVAKLGSTQFDPEVVEAMMEIWRQLELPALPAPAQAAHVAAREPPGTACQRVRRGLRRWRLKGPTGFAPPAKPRSHAHPHRDKRSRPVTIAAL